MRIVVLSQSRTGNTRRAAEMVGGSAEAAGHEVSVHPVTEPDLDALAEADLVIIGTWCDGAIFFGHRPGDARKIKMLPKLHGVPVAAYVTYAYHAGKAVDRFAKLLERQGMDVVATESLRRDLLPAGVDAFVDRATEAVAQRSAA